MVTKATVTKSKRSRGSCWQRVVCFGAASPGAGWLKERQCATFTPCCKPTRIQTLTLCVPSRKHRRCAKQVGSRIDNRKIFHIINRAVRAVF